MSMSTIQGESRRYGIGSSNSNLSLANENPTRFSKYPQLRRRKTARLPLCSFIPAPEKLYDDARANVEACEDVSLLIVTTAKAEEFYSNPPDDLVAVIIPTFNVGGYIVDTLRSAAIQSHQNLHLIVVDDGSTDTTSEKVLGFMNASSEDLAITFAQIPHIGNPGVTRNVGLYNFLPHTVAAVTFMDGDDVYATSTAIACLIGALGDCKNAIAAYGDYACIFESGQFAARPRGLKKTVQGEWVWRKASQLTWKNLAQGRLGPFHLQCLMVRNGSPFIPYNPLGEDGEYYASLFRISASGHHGGLAGVIQVPEIIANYRKRSSSISQKPSRYDWRRRGSKPYRQQLPHGAPAFYANAGIPDSYVTKGNVSQWLTRQWVRSFYSACRNGGIAGGIEQIRRALTNRRIRKIDLAWIPLESLLLRQSVRNVVGVFFRRAHFSYSSRKQPQ